jgi:hypothetical protein
MNEVGGRNKQFARSLENDKKVLERGERERERERLIGG